MPPRTNNGLKNVWIISWCLVSIATVYVVFFRSEDVDRAVALNTLCLGLFSASIAIPLGVLAAWAANGRGWLSRALLIACVCLLVIPVFAHVAAWDSAFGRMGWLTTAKGEVLTPIISDWVSAVWIHAVAATPQVAIILLIGLTVGRRVFEEQAILETNRWSVFVHVTLPRLIPLAFLCLIWILVSCSREIAVTDIYQIGTLAEQIYLGFSLGQYNLFQDNLTEQQIAGAQSLGPAVTIAVIGWVMVTGVWFFSAMTDFEIESDQWKPDQIGHHRSSWMKNLLAVILLVILVAIPIGNLFYRASFLVRSIDGAPTATHSFSQLFASLNYVFVQYRTEFFWSTIIAVVSASLIMMFVSTLTWLACRWATWKTIYILAITVCCAIPGPLFGSWLSRLFSSLTHPTFVWLYDRTIFAPVIATFFFCWPLAGLIVWFLFRKTAVDCLENSQIEGANWFSQLVRIVIPGNRKALLGCWLISFALCFGELSTSQMILPPGMDTVPRTTLGLLHAGVDEITAALTIVTVAVIIVVSWVGWWCVSLNPQRKNRE